VHGFCDRDASLTIACCLKALSAGRDVLAGSILSQMFRQARTTRIWTGVAVLALISFGILVTVAPQLLVPLSVLPTALIVLVGRRHSRSMHLLAKHAAAETK